MMVSVPLILDHGCAKMGAKTFLILFGWRVDLLDLLAVGD